MNRITPQRFLDTLSVEYDTIDRDNPELPPKFTPWEDRSQAYVHRHRSFHNQRLAQKLQIQRKFNSSLRTNYVSRDPKPKPSNLSKSKVSSIKRINYPTMDVTTLPFDYLESIDKNKTSVFRRTQFVTKRKKKDSKTYGFHETSNKASGSLFERQQKTLDRLKVRDDQRLYRQRPQERFNKTQIINMPLQLIQPSKLSKISANTIIAHNYNPFLHGQKLKRHPQGYANWIPSEGKGSRGLSKLLELSNSLFADVFKDQIMT